jgi:hypothetical protein
VSYYKKKSDKEAKGVIPLLGSAINRVPGKEPIFSISNESLVTKKSKSPVVEFQMDSEQDLQEWLLPLKALAGVTTTFRSSDVPVTYVSSELRKTWLSSVNNEGETALHVLSKFRNRKSTGELIVPTARILQLAMWLIDNGCPIDYQDKNKQTALHIAIRFGNLEMARCFIAKGANTQLTNNEGRKIADICTDAVLKEITENIIGADWQRALSIHLTSSSRLRGYSYLSFHFQKHSQTSSSHR